MDETLYSYVCILERAVVDTFGNYNPEAYAKVHEFIEKIKKHAVRNSKT